MVYVSPTINVLSLSVRKIGRRLIRDFNEIENLQNSIKGTQIFLLKTKTKLKKTIEFDLRKIKEDHEIFFLDEHQDITSDKAWLVDVINGTDNFQKAIPHFCIAVSLTEKQETIISVIYDPIKDELYCAQKGKGSYLNDYRLKLSENSSTNLSTISTSSLTYLNLNNTIKSILDKFDQIRIFGSDLLDFCYLANGKFDAVVFHDKKNKKEIGKLISNEANAIIIENIGGTEYSIICNKNSESKIRNILTEKVEI